MKGKVVLVTGSAGGIGAETSVAFASMGSKLAIVDKGSLQDTLLRCLEMGLEKEEVLPIQVDLTVHEQLEAVVEKTLAHFGRLDVLVNNAGIGCPLSLEGTSETAYDLTMSINCRSVFFLTQKAVPHLARTKGCVVNVSSVFGLRPTSIGAAYCISKCAVNQLTQCAALEFSKYRVRVNAVNPGHVRTNILKAFGYSDVESEEKYEKLEKMYPLGRIGTPADVVKAILFLADDAQSGFITGACLPVDGGFQLGSAKN